MTRVVYKVLLGCMLSLVSEASMASDLESQLLLAYIYNLGKFVDWPTTALLAEAPVRICFYGDIGSLSGKVSQLEDKKIQGHAIQTREVTRGGALNDCQIVYISESEQVYFSLLIDKIKNKPILSISHSDSFIPSGGMINFTYAEDKLRFDVNKQAISTSTLGLSSQVLRLARKVVEQ
jgi:YfiR/HmsC-like